NPPRQRSKAKSVQSWVGQPFLAVPYFFGHATSFNSSAKSPPLNFYFSFRLSTSLCSPPVYNEVPSWLRNPACLMARARANSSNPARRAYLSATPSPTLSIPPLPPPAPATPPASSDPRSSPTRSASTP